MHTPHRLGSKVAGELAAHELLHRNTILKSVFCLLPNLEISSRLLETPVAKVAAACNRRASRIHLVSWICFRDLISNDTR